MYHFIKVKYVRYNIVNGLTNYCNIFVIRLVSSNLKWFLVIPICHICLLFNYIVILLLMCVCVFFLFHFDSCLSRKEEEKINGKKLENSRRTTFKRFIKKLIVVLMTIINQRLRSFSLVIAVQLLKPKQLSKL